MRVGPARDPLFPYYPIRSGPDAAGSTGRKDGNEAV